MQFEKLSEKSPEREARIGAYEAAREATDEIDGVYRSVADLLGASPEEIRMLRAICKHMGDRACIERASALLSGNK